jgi:hypothetical protein
MREQMKDNRAMNKVGNDSPDSIRRAGGEDLRRYDAKIIMDRKVMDHSISGYNHNGVKDPESAIGNNEHMSKMDRRAMQMGSPMPDGTYKR